MNQSVKTIGINEVMAFARQQALSVVLRGAVSLGIVLALLALYYAFAPRKDGYRQEMVVTLENNGGNAVYPNKRMFSSADLISAPVLNRVWKERKLSGSVKFEDFCKWFSITGYDSERAKLDAEYQAKMAKRNITVTELTTLQHEYESKLAALSSNNRYLVTMRPTCVMSRENAVEMLTAVPAAWFAEYSVLNAPQIPSLMHADVMNAHLKRAKEGNGRAVELMDTLRLFQAEIQATCKYIRTKVLCGRNVRIDGVDLGAYESRLDLVRSELLRMKNAMLSNGDPADLEDFVASHLDDLACETLTAEEKALAVRQTIDMLKDTTGREVDGASRTGAKADGNVTLQTDASFFKDFTAMIRRDASQQTVQKYADELLQYTKELADIKARKLYYDQISQYAAKTRVRENSQRSSRLYSALESFVAEMREIGAQVTAFRDRALEIYRTSDQFFALPAPAQYFKGFPIPLSRIALGLLALWAIYNLLCLVAAWNATTKN